VGVNPVVFKFEDSVRDGKPDSDYWRNMRSMLLDAPLGVDLRPRAAYLDIFYFRHTEQDAIKNELINAPGWLKFAEDQLRLTQYTIEEVIKPKLIVIANKESYAYWGKEEKYVWMGYTFEKIEDTQYGELCVITGLQPSGRIAPEMHDTQLKDTTRVLFSRSHRFLSKDKRPSAAFLQQQLSLLS
jgi:hypothetical protein